MTRSDFLGSVAGSAAALVQDYDLTGMLVRTIAETAEAIGADSAGLLVTGADGELELLSATSHAAVALETYQAVTGEGPCRACIDQQAQVRASRSEVADQWPELGALMERAGYELILAVPLRWHGVVLGGLNIFWTRTLQDSESAAIAAEAQVFADLLTLFIVNSDPMTPEAARRQVQAALEARAVIEQAKGVIAQQEDLEMPEAYLRLRELAQAPDRSLTEVARAVIRSAQGERTGSP